MGLTFTKEYQEILQRSHQEVKTWGESATKGKRWELLESWLNLSNSRDVLDYGCSTGSLGKLLTKKGYSVQNYDPGFPEFSTPPNPAEIVVCTDVLEHIEPELIDNVIEHLFSLTKERCYILICIGPAYHILPDGRNAHLIQEPKEWWLEKFSKYENWNVTLRFLSTTLK